MNYERSRSSGTIDTVPDYSDYDRPYERKEKFDKHENVMKVKLAYWWDFKEHWFKNIMEVLLKIGQGFAIAAYLWYLRSENPPEVYITPITAYFISYSVSSFIEAIVDLVYRCSQSMEIKDPPR